MEYPGNFETPAFPAGTRIAVSRMMSVLALIAFLIVVFLCGILVWSARSDKLVPFLISTNNDTGEWTIVGRTSDTLEHSAAYAIQESIIWNFTNNWFQISLDSAQNDAAWKKCERDKCNTGDTLASGTRECVIYCATSDEVYSKFIFNVVPNYRARAESGEGWTPDGPGITITPNGKISESGGSWMVTANIYSGNNGLINVKAFVKIARDKNNHQKTMGFYVSDFNSYKMN